MNVEVKQLQFFIGQRDLARKPQGHVDPFRPTGGTRICSWLSGGKHSPRLFQSSTWRRGRVDFRKPIVLSRQSVFVFRSSWFLFLDQLTGKNNEKPHDSLSPENIWQVQAASLQAKMQARPQQEKLHVELLDGLTEVECFESVVSCWNPALRYRNFCWASEITKSLQLATHCQWWHLKGYISVFTHQPFW